MEAPSSAQTSPSQITSRAPNIQPSIACGPPIAAMISGIVINGPTPIMSIMLSAVAPVTSTPRISLSCLLSVIGRIRHIRLIGRICPIFLDQSRSMKTALDILHRKPQDNGPPVRARSGGSRYQKPVDQPSHFLGRELHVDLH